MDRNLCTLYILISILLRGGGQLVNQKNAVQGNIFAANLRMQKKTRHKARGKACVACRNMIFICRFCGKPLHRVSANSSVTFMLSPVWGMVTGGCGVAVTTGAGVAVGAAVGCAVAAGRLRRRHHQGRRVVLAAARSHDDLLQFWRTRWIWFPCADIGRYPFCIFENMTVQVECHGAGDKVKW